jgi:hypothetical protein
MKRSRTYSQRSLKVLWGLSGGVCAFPGCTTPVIESSEEHGPIVIGEIAHIFPNSDRGPRSPSLDDIEARGDFDNLIVLCPTHHTLVDKDPLAFPESVLRTWKGVHESNIRSAVERWKDGRLFLALTRDQTLQTIAFYNEAIQFDYSNPLDYRRLQMLLSKQRLFEYWCDLAKVGVNDSRDLYEVGQKLAGFMRIVGFPNEARTIYKHLETMLAHVFEPSTIEFKNQSRLIIHNLYAGDDDRGHEVEFCIQEFGDLHVHTIASLTCRGCVLVRSGQLEIAEEVLADCTASLEQLGTESPVRSAYLSFQLGKLNYFLAVKHQKSPTHLSSAIHHLKAALDYFTLVRADHVTRNYVHFFLFKALNLSEKGDDAAIHFAEARRFFSSTPVRNMCHYDFRQLEVDLKLLPNK